MPKIALSSDNQNSATSVSNIFIDEYMSDANGEFVKIYLYLLRLMNAPDAAFSISSIADKFEHTEKDIKRALCYWERMHLLRLEYDDKQNLTGICLLDSTQKVSGKTDKPSDTAVISEVTAAPAAPAKKSYSADDIKTFRQNESIAELFFITERYLARTLSATDINTILYLYDGLGFSADLIEYLIEYCVSKGHTSIRYIEKVALGWADSNIKTVDDAKQASSLHSQSYFTVMKALGISGRNLVPAETDFIEKWKSKYGFSNELISEACQRTIQMIHQPSFEYTDSILTNWHNKKIHNLSDVAKLDTEYQNQKKTAKVSSSAGSAANSGTSKNKFNNFKQRSYDYDELEKNVAHNYYSALTQEDLFMPLNNSQYDEIIREYDARQLRNQHILESRIKDAYERIPRLKAIDDAIASCSVAQAKRLLDGDNAALDELRSQIAAYRSEKASLLAEHGIPTNYFDSVYTCPDCKDTGYVNGKRCHFEQAAINLVYTQSNLKEVLEKENFNTFSFDYYSDDDINPATGLSSLATAKDAVAKCHDFINSFDNSFSNLYFYGDTGIGKTFLSNCIAKELMDQGHSVIYFTAFQLFDILSKGVFKKDENAIAAHQNIFDCDLLIIDDLGTELTNSFTTSQLFLCLNERILRKKSTIISTNLGMNQLADIYSERVLSRISSNYTLIKLFGADIRILKKARSRAL